MKNPDVLMFDVFGTVVDWRTSIMGQLADFAKQKSLYIDCAKIADDWRAMYQPAMEMVRSGQRDWTILDVLHLESLIQLSKKHTALKATDDELVELSKAWHRLNPWADTVKGLNLLKSKAILSTMSNGNTALLVNMAKHANLPWDVVLGAETARAYKPKPEAYLNNIAMLGRLPEQCLMVAAHNEDLHAATAVGMRTAFVVRPQEHGVGQTIDLEPNGDWDIVCESFIELAEKLD